MVTYKNFFNLNFFWNASFGKETNLKFLFTQSYKINFIVNIKFTKINLEKKRRKSYIFNLKKSLEKRF